jgi:hypothetical protein
MNTLGPCLHFLIGLETLNLEVWTSIRMAPAAVASGTIAPPQEVSGSGSGSDPAITVGPLFFQMECNHKPCSNYVDKWVEGSLYGFQSGAPTCLEHVDETVECVKSTLTGLTPQSAQLLHSAIQHAHANVTVMDE